MKDKFITYRKLINKHIDNKNQIFKIFNIIFNDLVSLFMV